MERVKIRNETFEIIFPGIIEKAMKGLSVRKGDPKDKSKLKLLVGGWEVSS
jgi:hypothetical protein